MANRHLLRSIAMQTLFEWDFGSATGPVSARGGAGSSDVNEILNRNLKEFAPGVEDSEFAEKLAGGVLKERKKLDAIIEKTAPEWPIKQIALVDRNVLRIGLFELLFGNSKEVPPRVAINEAIELAKSFGGETSGKFVNGVLGTVYREMGEPGKDDENTKTKELPLEKLGGAVVYRKDDKSSDFLFAMVHDVFGYWTLSKGGLEGEENSQEGTKREIKEELGISIEIEDELGVNEYVASHPEKGLTKKSVTYFLARTNEKGLKLESSGGLDDARWFKEEELIDLKIYDDLKPLIAKAIKILSAKGGSAVRLSSPPKSSGGKTKN